MEFTSLGNIERRYAERATGFQPTLRFLTVLSVIRQEEGKLFAVSHSQNFSSENVEELSSWLVNMIIASGNPYRSEIFSYLSRFEVKNGTAEYRPGHELRSTESAVRNFMMELGMVCYDKVEDRYSLTHDCASLFAIAVSGSASVSPHELQTRQKQCERLGMAAETVALVYERDRVGLQYAHKVNHVAIRNAIAGYDIESVTLCADDKVLPRYIEVKAVPRETYRFYWSANERGVAKSFGSWYYLYLVPVDQSGNPCIKGLRVLSDPCHNLLRNAEEWIVEEGVIECSLRCENKSDICGKEKENDDR